MKKIIKILSIPLARFGIGLVGTIIFVSISSAFPPLAIIMVPFVFLTLMFGETEVIHWFESDEKEECSICGEETGIKLVRVKHCMHPIIPLPIIFQLCALLRIPYNSTYYKVCEKCKDTHVEENDFNAIQTIANGGLANVQEITKQEFEVLLKR